MTTQVSSPLTKWRQTASELAAGVTPTDISYEPGNVMRYGAVSDSGSGSQGTDCAAAFQAASDSGHTIYVPEGWYSIESTVTFKGTGGAEAGGKNFIGSTECRVERYTNVSTPIFHIYGNQMNFDGNGMILAARNFGGFTKGLMLYGQDPDGTVGEDSFTDTMNGTIRNFKIIGNSTTGVTGKDGSIGFYGESSARRRGSYLLGGAINSYYSTFINIYCLQWDYCFFLGTDFNAHSFHGCTALSFGSAAWWINGYQNSLNGCKVETPIGWDTRERYAFKFGNKDEGPEAVMYAAGAGCESDATTVAITGITKGSPTTITCGSAHGESTGGLIKLDGIVDNGPDGDLETALNTAHFTITSTGANTFTIPLDTSGLTNTWASGGTVNVDPYPILGARTNHIVGGVEIQYEGSTKVTRIFGQTRPIGAADTEKIYRGKWGKNCVDVTGTSPGGVGPSGFSTRDYILNNIVKYTNAVADYESPISYHGFQFRSLDDLTGSSIGTDEYKVFSGRMANLAESTAFNVLTVDNIGPDDAGVNLKLTFMGKEDANSDVHAGEISWLCPVTVATARTPIKYKDFQANENDENVTWSITAAAGTDTDTGKFTLVLTTGSTAGTGNFYYAWKVEVLHSQLEGTNLDWDDDISIINGGQ